MKSFLYYGDLPLYFCDVFNGCERIKGVCDNCWAVGNVARFAANPNEKLKARYGGLTYFNDSGEHRLGDCYDWTGETTYCPDQLSKYFTGRDRVVAFSWRGDWMYRGHDDGQVGYAMTRMRDVGFGSSGMFLTLTKRPKRLAEFCKKSEAWDYYNENNNIWYGTTAWNQESLERNAYQLLKVPGKKFLMLEPLLGEVDLSTTKLGAFSWVVVGAETGRNARPCNPEWIRRVVFQCQNAGVPVLVKQWDSKRTKEPRVEEYPEELKKYLTEDNA